MKADQVSQYTGTHCSEMTGMQAKLQRPICGGGGGDRGEIIPMPSAAFPILRGYACIRVYVGLQLTWARGLHFLLLFPSLS